MFQLHNLAIKFFIKIPQMDSNTDTSLSFLEPLHNTDEKQEPVVPFPAVSPSVIDPAFLNCTIDLPRKIEKLFKNTNRINVIYRIVDGDCIIIKHVSKGIKPYHVYVDSFHTFSFPPNPQTHIIFITGRLEFKTAFKTQQAREYKESIVNGAVFVGEDKYRELRMQYLKYQLETKVNIIFIDGADELHRHTKNIATIIEKDTRYVPKVKTHPIGSKTDFMKNTLKQISGVSENVARCICEKYNDFRSLRKALLEHREEIASLTVYDETKVNTRVLGDKICQKLSHAFTSNDRSKRI